MYIYIYILHEAPSINCQYDNFSNTLNLFKNKYNFKDVKYNNYRNETEIDINDSKITSHVCNRSLNDKNEISFNDESIIYHSTQNDRIKLNSSAEINIQIDKLLAPIRRSNRLKEKVNLT